jgi:hypothetical protein
MNVPVKSALTKKQRLQVEEEEAKARGLISEIVPLLHELPADSVPHVSEHLEKALEDAKKGEGDNEEVPA